MRLLYLGMNALCDEGFSLKLILLSTSGPWATKIRILEHSVYNNIPCTYVSTETTKKQKQVHIC